MRLLKRIAPFAIIVLAALLLLYLPDVGPERYTDLATFFKVERSRQSLAGLAVAVVADGGPAYVDALGRDGEGRALRADSRLCVGAPSQTFAGVLAMSLARDRALAVDAPVRTYLPWFGFAGGAGSDVTVRHLLSHTSGISDLAFDDEHPEAGDLDGAVRSLLGARPVAPPGAEFHYLKTGYQALGLAIEKIGGGRYPDLLARAVFEPLGMRDSTARPEDLRVSLPQGNGSFFGAAIQRAQGNPPFGAPTSTVVTTAADLGRYLAFLVAPERQRRPPIGPRSARSLFEPLVPAAPFGWGWYLEERDGLRTARHDGAFDGFSSRLALWPDRRSGVAVVATQNSFLLATFALPALTEGARRIVMEGSAPRPFPLGRLYALLAVMAAVHVIVLSWQAGSALRWAKDAKGRSDAAGSPIPLRLTLARTALGLVARGLLLALAPMGLGLALGRTVGWRAAFALEPGLAAWLASACFFGVLRNAARLAWLRGASPFRRKR